MKLNHIYHQPCGSLSEIPDGSIDAIVTSPPYNISAKKAQRKKLHNLTGYDGFDDNMPEDEYQKQQVELLNACCRVLKPIGSMFYIHKPRHVDGIEISPHAWINRSDCVLYQTLIWNRKSTHNHDPRHMWPVYECIYHLVTPQSKPRLDKKCAKWTSIWSIDFSETKNYAHPAPFPRELVWRCVQWCAVPLGGIVLDPYMGSGTTAEVAVDEGLYYIGYEISDKYIKIAKNRIAQGRMRRALIDPQYTAGKCTIPDLFKDE